MVQKLQKFWFPINLVLWVTIIGNLILGIVSVIKFYSTLAWVEAFFNVVIAIIVLVWLNNLYKVLRFDTTMAELVSIQK
jgi:amino acid permease